MMKVVIINRNHTLHATYAMFHIHLHHTIIIHTLPAKQISRNKCTVFYFRIVHSYAHFYVLDHFLGL